MDVRPNVSVDLPSLSGSFSTAVIWKFLRTAAGPLLAAASLLLAGSLGAVAVLLLAPLMIFPLLLVTPLMAAAAVATYKQNVRRKEQRHAVLGGFHHWDRLACPASSLKWDCIRMSSCLLILDLRYSLSSPFSSFVRHSLHSSASWRHSSLAGYCRRQGQVGVGERHYCTAVAFSTAPAV